jgi:flagellar motor component MotA
MQMHIVSASLALLRVQQMTTPAKRDGRISLEATRRSFNKDFLLALAADFKKHGAAAIEKVRKTQPATYMKICALLVPREMQIEHSSTIKQMSDEQIEEAIAAIKAMLAAQAGETAKVIEGEAEVVPSLPAPARPTKAS